MTCDESIRLLHLSRPGERSEDDDRRLTDHLRTCPVCSAEAVRIRSGAPAYDGFLVTRVPETSPAVQAGRIARLVTSPGTNRDVFSLVTLLAQRRSVRIAYAAVSLAACAMMGWQLTERYRISEPGVARNGPYLMYSVDAGEIRNAGDLPLPDALKARLRSGGRIDIRKQDLLQTADRAGSAVVRMMFLTQEQRRIAESILTALERSSVLSFRIGPTGG